MEICFCPLGNRTAWCGDRNKNSVSFTGFCDYLICVYERRVESSTCYFKWHCKIKRYFKLQFYLFLFSIVSSFAFSSPPLHFFHDLSFISSCLNYLLCLYCGLMTNDWHEPLHTLFIFWLCPNRAPGLTAVVKICSAEGCRLALLLLLRLWNEALWAREIYSGQNPNLWVTCCKCPPLGIMIPGINSHCVWPLDVWFCLLLFCFPFNSFSIFGNIGLICYWTQRIFQIWLFSCPFSRYWYKFAM